MLLNVAPLCACVDLVDPDTFNRAFGAEPVNYWMLYRNALPWHIRILKRLKDGL